MSNEGDFLDARITHYPLHITLASASELKTLNVFSSYNKGYMVNA
jgi:hypothetical protein